MRTLSPKATGPLLAGLLLLSGCSGGDTPEPAPRQSASPSPTATQDAPGSVPWKVVVTRVSGRLPKKSVDPLEGNVRATLAAYVDGAFLSGDYPREDFGAAYDAFTAGARADARRDQDLLTNHPLGATTTSVRATRRTAYLSVLAPYKVAAGVTAKVDLVFVVDRGDDTPAQRVAVAGRLLLTRDKGNDWRIFGYDLHRSATPRSDS